MNSLKLLTLVIVSVGMSGCLSFHSESTPGPQGPQGPAGSSEKIIVVPDNKTDKKIKVVPERSY